MPQHTAANPATQYTKRDPGGHDSRDMAKPFRAVFHEFKGGSFAPEEVEGSGDVKYHLGASSDREFDDNKVHLSLTANPSHLEIVNPVVLGKVRAKQDRLEEVNERGSRTRDTVLPLLIHGDAAFAGQPPTEATATELAQLFSVSREFVFRKFLDRDLITPAEYDQAARRWVEQGQRGTGGDHYNTKIAYLGTEYINLAFQRFYQNRIDYNQLADILDTKPKNLTRLEEYVSRRAP